MTEQSQASWHGDDDRHGPQGRQGRHRRRRPGVGRPDGHQAQRQEGPRRSAKGDVIAGFAGATADAFTLFERLEAKLEQYPGQLMRAASSSPRTGAPTAISAGSRR